MRPMTACARGAASSIRWRAPACFRRSSINMLRVGEETGSLTRSLLHMADLFEDKLDTTVQRTLTLLEPVIILLVSGFIATVIISIMSAVISINDLALKLGSSGMERILTVLRRRLRDGGRGREGEAGFTLVELLVVMVILVLLAGLVAPRVMGYLSSSRTKTAKVQIESLSTSLELFKLDVGRYPNEREGLAALVARPGNVANLERPVFAEGQGAGRPLGQSL